MSDVNVQGLTRLNPVYDSPPNQIQASQSNQTENSQDGKEAGKLAKATADDNSKTEVPVTKESSELIQTRRDVRLKFKIDPDTDEVTVLVLDKSNDELIRTIPSEELKNMREGGLIELST